MTGTRGLLVCVALSLACVSLVAVAGACLSRPAWRSSPHLAAAYGLLAVGVVGSATFFLYLVSPRVGEAGAGALAAAAVATVVRTAWTHRASFRDRRRSLLAPALLMAGTVLVTVGLLALRQHSGTWFEMTTRRFSHPLPIDNQIPSMMATRLRDGTGLHGFLVGDWLSSDRPPLQAGLLLFTKAVAGWSGVSTSDLDFAAGMAAQLAWLPACYALLRSLGAGRRPTILAVAFAASSGTVLVNTVFTWPKLLSAAFVMAALAVLLEHSRTRIPAGALIAAGALTGLGALSHGAAVFAAPLLVYAVLRRGGRPSYPGIAGAVAGMVALYLPWVAFQKFYAPPGDRLLKWHLAGVMDNTDLSLGTLLVRAYTRPPVATLVHDKLANLAVPFAHGPWSGLGQALVGHPGPRRFDEFFTLSSALGLGVVPLVALLAVAVARRRHRAATDVLGTRATALVVAVAASLLFWCLLMYGPGTTVLHQGSHVPVLLLLTVPVAWLAGRLPKTAVLLLVLQGAFLAVTYGPGSTSAGSDPVSWGPLSWTAVGAIMLGVVGTAASIASAGRRDSAAHRPSEGMPDARPVAWDDDSTRPLPAVLAPVALEVS